MSSGLFFTYLSIQHLCAIPCVTLLRADNLRRASTPASINHWTWSARIRLTVFIPNHFHELRRASHPLQHSGLAGPYFFTLFYTYSSFKAALSWAPACFSPTTASSSPWALSLNLILYSSFQAALSWASACCSPTSASSNHWAWWARTSSHYSFLTIFMSSCVLLIYLLLILYSSFKAALSWAPACFSPTSAFRTRWALRLCLILYLLFFSGCSFVSSGVLLTYFSIQDSLGLTSLRLIFNTLCFRLHFHELRRASHLLQHPAVPLPYVFALFYTYSSFQAALSWAPACFSPTSASSSRWAWPP